MLLACRFTIHDFTAQQRDCVLINSLLRVVNLAVAEFNFQEYLQVASKVLNITKIEGTRRASGRCRPPPRAIVHSSMRIIGTCECGLGYGDISVL